MADENRTSIIVTSGFGHRMQQPYVQILIELADYMTQMTPATARELALNLLCCAEAAEQDAFFVTFLRKQVGAKDEHIARLLIEFRSWREKRIPPP